MRTWQLGDEIPHSAAIFWRSLSTVCSWFCSYGINENGTAGGPAYKIRRVIQLANMGEMN